MNKTLISFITITYFFQFGHAQWEGLAIGALSAAAIGGMGIAQGSFERDKKQASIEYLKSKEMYDDLQKRQQLISEIQSHSQQMTDTTMKNTVNRQDVSEQTDVQLIQQVKQDHEQIEDLQKQLAGQNSAVDHYAPPNANTNNAQAQQEKIKKVQSLLQVAMEQNPSILEFFKKNPSKYALAIQTLVEKLE